MLPNPKWAPTFHTPRRHPATDGDDLIKLAETQFHVLKGFKAGEPLRFTAWQRWLLRALYERTPQGRLRYRRALIGLPRKQGKSLMGSAIAVYGMIAGEAGAEVYAVAGDRQQARIVFNEARQQIQMSPRLAAVARVYRDAIEMPMFGSVFRVLSSEFKSQAGLNPSLVIFDELWNQPTADLFDQMSLGSGARVEPLVLSITTAGYDLDTLAGRQYSYGKQCAQGEVVDDTFGCWWWEARADCDIRDRQQWRASNPNLADGLLALDDLDTAVKQTSESAFRRWRLNQWARALECWLPAGAWEACRDDLPLDNEAATYVGVDMALKHDSVAVVLAQPQGDRIVVRSRIWNPDGNPIDIAEVEAHLRHLHAQYRVVEFAYDPAYFQRSAEALADDGLPMVEFPQSAQRMVPACGNAYELIVNRRLAHDGSPSLADHVLSAAQRITDAGWRLSKNKSKRKIDACIALVIALDRATTRLKLAQQASVVNVW